ncbi:MAG: hypothetical protein QOF02_3405 [Blastocatellia bacterium]|nr:hypothetical protein [Blastocatellia bacterium]
MKRRTEITVKTDRLIVVRREQRAGTAAWCESCAKPATMLSVDDAAAVARSSSRAIYRRVEADTLHFTETPEGRLLICLNSLEAG